MPYQYKREPLNDDEVNKLTNACESFEEKFVVWTLLDSGLRVSEFSNLSKDNIQWQEKRFIRQRRIYLNLSPEDTIRKFQDKW